jgi:hypothetical protein
MGESRAINRVEPVTLQEATRALETLGNLLYLTSQSAENPTQVRKFMSDSERCVGRLAGYLRYQVKKQ